MFGPARLVKAFPVIPLTFILGKKNVKKEKSTVRHFESLGAASRGRGGLSVGRLPGMPLRGVGAAGTRSPPRGGVRWGRGWR